MIFRNSKQVLLSVLIASLLGGVVATDAIAQSRGADRHGHGSGKPEVLYPNATRKEPGGKASTKMSGKLQKLFAAYNKQDDAETRKLADEIIGDANANDYDKAVANQLAAQAAYNLDDSAAAKQYLQQAIDLNQLDNNGHLQALRMLAQLQLQDEQYDVGLANLDKFFAESGSHKPEEMVIKGQALYQTDHFAEAIPVLKDAIAAAGTDAKDNWSQVLMASYAGAAENAETAASNAKDANNPAEEARQTAEANRQYGEAIKVAQALADKNPDDIKSQENLANMYMRADQMPQAAAVMEKLRAAGRFTDEREYKMLYSIYANTDNKERDVISVINEGIAKGILKPDHQVYLALAQSYYYSDQIPQAIEAWQKAAPLSSDGETYLNLAKVLQGEGRIPEAKDAARQALAKGVKNPADANKIINLK